MRKKYLSLTVSSAMLLLALPVALFAADSAISFTGTLTGMSGSDVPATLTVTAGATTYTVEVTSSTNLVRRFNGGSGLQEFMIGDTLEVRGTLSDSTTNTVNANKIKDASIQRRGGTFYGSVVSLDCANNRFTFKPDERSQQTVYVTSSTKIIRGGEKITCTDLKVNERAIVIGTWRPANNRIDADRVIVKFRGIAGTLTNIELTNGGLPATLTIRHGSGQLWTINVTSSTKLLRRYMKTASIEEFAVGDKVEARGTLAGERIINAKMVRDNSLTMKHRDFVSRIYSIDDAAGTFVIKISGKNGVTDVTVTTSSSTKIYNDEELISFDDLGVGTKVKILGEYNSSAQTIAATRIIVKD